MITEDYVSFETAKLLKEKGFDAYGDGSFNSGIRIFAEYSPNGQLTECLTSKPHVKAYPAPTLQMAMKWLRIHKLFIDIEYYGESGNFNWSILNMDRKGALMEFGEDAEDTYEESVESAIKYCLENLI